jgi:hypothetical protein
VTPNDPDRTDPIAPLREQLAGRGYELLAAPPDARGAASSGRITVSAGTLRSFEIAGHGTLYALVPVQLSLVLDPSGRIAAMTGGQPNGDDVDAVRDWLDDLIAGRLLDDPRQSTPAPRATHMVVTGSDGRPVVRRKGFSAT